MKNEFNPTNKDLLNLEQLILDIKSKKEKLVNVKMGLQNSLSKLRTEIQEERYESKSFFKLKKKRDDVKGAVASLEIKIKSCNEELRFKNKLKNEVVFFIKNNKKLEGQDDLNKVILKLEKLKKKYKDFSKDRTRIASLRVMSLEFMEELESILN